MVAIRSILRTAGSLWFAGLLLVLLLVAMACATIVEPLHGTEWALATFYRAWWFQTLMGLLCVNVAAAVLWRYPFAKRQIGFVLTHAAILVTLGGAVLTQQVGIEGQLAVTEGQTVEFFSIAQDRLTILNRRDQTSATADLTAPAFRSLKAVDRPSSSPLELGPVQITVERYLPDSVWSRRVTESDDPALKPAVEVSLSLSGRENPTWIIAGQPAGEAVASVAYRLFADVASFERAISPEPAETRPASAGLLQITYNDQTFEIPLEDCTDQPTPLGDTGLAVRVLRHVRHAVVGPDGRLAEASDQRDNPAVELEIVTPDVAVRRIAFANFPGFSHGRDQLSEIQVTFVATDEPQPIAPLEILGGPTGELYVRFQLRDQPRLVTRLTLGTPVETPWPGWKFTALRQFAHARVEDLLQPRQPGAGTRLPGLLLKVTAPEESVKTWVQKYDPHPLLIGGNPFELAYADKRVPLGFALTLNHLHLGTYPGETMPRSYESHIATLDRATGRERSHVVSMNHPAEHGGYTFYQMRMSEPDRLSVLGVSRDPGQPIVFTGYVLLLLGMTLTLGTRVVEQRRAARRRSTAVAESGA